MKQIYKALYGRTSLYILFCVLLISGVGCRKNDSFTREDDAVISDASNAHSYSADVIDKWITMQIRLDRDAVGIPNVAFVRYYAYSGVAALESLAPGLLQKDALSSKWNGLTGLPHTESLQNYYWPASVNTALAFMNRSIFTTASAIDKAAIDSLENALNTSFLAVRNADVILRSDAFGHAVAHVVFAWSETDGYKHATDPYTPPVAPGLWVPTPPSFAIATWPYFGNARPIVKGSGDNTQPGPPVAYSESQSSPFYKMVKQVYNASQNLTQDQINMALFWRDIPGVTAGGHWLSILQQVLKQTNSRLDKAAFAYAVTGVCLSDAGISCWQTKYHYNLVRPITYIRNVMGYTSWLSTLTTPAHPEYSSAHAVISSAISDAFTAVFGNIGSFTDHTYDYRATHPGLTVPLQPLVKRQAIQDFMQAFITGLRLIPDLYREEK